MHRLLPTVGFLVLILGTVATPPPTHSAERAKTEGAIKIELRSSENGSHQWIVSGFDQEQIKSIQQRQPANDLGKIFAVYVGETAVDERPAILGETRWSNRELVFAPRYPLEPGLSYRAVLRLPAAGNSGPVEASRVFSLDKPAEEPAVVTQIYPTADVLPENQLKFYLHFSRPMSRGEAYRHVTLLGSDGRPVEDPFLELGEELWDRSGTRFTLFFDPGRIKRGLKPREEVGPALEEGKSYTLVVRAAWPDAVGRPLASEFRKSFRVAAPDDDQPLVDKWRVNAPPAGTRKPLTVHFPEPLDHAMLQRVLHVSDAAGKPVSGEIAISDQETCWRLTPKSAWRPGEYRLTIETALEDLAGNSIRRPFEVDVARPVEREEIVDVATLPFTVTAP